MAAAVLFFVLAAPIVPLVPAPQIITNQPLQTVVPSMLAEPKIRAGAGLVLKAALEPSKVGLGETAVLTVAIHNEATETATAVQLQLTLPPELVIANLIRVNGVPMKVFDPHAEGPIRFIDPIPSGEMGKAVVHVSGTVPGLYQIDLEATALKFASVLAMVYLVIEEEPPDEPLKTITTDDPRTTSTDEPKTTVSDEPNTTTTDEPRTSTTPKSSTSGGGPAPGFELLPALIGISFFLFFRRRRNRRR